MIVVDTSVAVKWAVKEPLHVEALRILDSNQQLLAPDLLLPELSSVLLAQTLASMTERDRAILLALAWLGRSYYSVDQWPQLVNNAQGLVSRGWEAHKSYVLAQMPDVEIGLGKLGLPFDQ